MASRIALESQIAVGLGVAAGLIAIPRHRSRRALERLAAAGLETLLSAIDANDSETGLHMRRVAAYALIIADTAGLDESERRSIERVALFHDIGKIHEALFDIVHDARPLTAEERRAILTHPRRGADVLAPLAAFYPELPIGVLSHHERWDGRGYPRKLRGARIPLEARIVTIADTFDALTHDRRYRRGRSISAALDVIAAGRGRQFDPSFVDLVLLPPVVERLTREHIAQHALPKRRPRGRRESVPDISFRWRSKERARR